MAWKHTQNLPISKRLLFGNVLAGHASDRPFFGKDDLILRVHGCTGAGYVQGWTVCSKEPWMAVLLLSYVRRSGISCLLELAPRQLLLHCSNKLHPCNDAISALPPSLVVVCSKEPWMAVLLLSYVRWSGISCLLELAPRQLLDNRSSITAPALFYLRAFCPNALLYLLYPYRRVHRTVRMTSVLRYLHIPHPCG